VTVFITILLGCCSLIVFWFFVTLVCRLVTLLFAFIINSSVSVFILGLLAGIIILRYIPTNLVALEQVKYSYGIPVPNMKGFIKSPYSDKGYIDVRGYVSDTEIKDPYSGNVILVP
jgi:hypothetical protein